jgi:Carboxypeptidase regulatory-like domain
MRITRFCCCCSILVLSFLAAACFFGGVCLPAVHAQGIITGGITGDVVDQSGAAIPGASVTARNEGTGAVMQAKSDALGSFRLADVPIGSYSVTVNAANFGPSTMSHVVVVAGNTTPLGKVALNLGKTAETVEVEGSASQLINTESAQGEEVLDTAQLATVPVAGAFDNVTLVVPGVVATHSDAFSNTNGVNYSVNGERGRSNNSEIDGQSNNDDSIGGPSFFFSNQDAIQEVQVITTDMGAQYGRNFGSVVNYITKSGTNTYHGSAFEYYLGSWGSSLVAYQKDPQYGLCPPGSNATFASNNGCTLITVPRFVENLYGGTLGGPVIKNKLFLFGSTFWAHEYQGSSPYSSGSAIFPDANGLTELASAFPNNAGAADLEMASPFALKGTGATAVGAPTMVPVTNGTATANIEMTGVSRALAQHVLDQEELGRLDYNLTSKDKIYIRYAYQNNPWIPAWYLYYNYGVADGQVSQVSGITTEVGGDWTHTFTTNMVNQLRYSFQQAKIGFFGGDIPSCTLSSFASCTSVVTVGGIAGEGFGYGFGSVLGGDSLPQGRFVKEDQVQDNAQWTRGRHTILFGGEYDFQDSPNVTLPNATGNFNFTPGDAGPLATPGTTVPMSSSSPYYNGFTAMLEDVGTLGLAAGSTSVPFREPDFAFYFQDNFKVLQNLTMDLGVRYEFFSPSVNLIHSNSVAQQTGPHPFWETSLPLSATTFPKVNDSYRNIEPRIGLAYTPPQLPKMVVHAGFAINVDPVFYNIFLNIATSAPVVNSGIVSNCNGTTLAPIVNCEPSGGFTYASVQAQDIGLIPTGIDPRINPITTVPSSLRNPMAETYTFGIQYQVAPAAVAEVRYVGNHTFDNFQSVNANPDILGVQVDGDGNSAFPSYGAGYSVCTTITAGVPANGYGRPNCNYNAVDSIGNTAFSIYNAMQASLTVRDFHHWTGTASYTWSRTIDNVSEIFSTTSGGTTNAFAQDPLNSDVGERGVSGNSYPSLWGIQMTYTDPFFTDQHGILGRLLGGYFLNSVYTYNGGQPFNPFQNSVAQSPYVNSSDPLASTNFCDATFATDFDFGGYISQCRPILANKSAPITSIGVNTGGGNYINYVTGASGARSSFHWLWNNQYEAEALGTPFPGVGRNTLRGDSWNDWDASLGKNFKVTERATVQLTINVFNVLNRAYYGTPDPNIEDSLGSPNTFLQNTFTGTEPGTAAGGGAYYAGFGNRNVQLSAHVNF